MRGSENHLQAREIGAVQKMVPLPSAIAHMEPEAGPVFVLTEFCPPESYGLAPRVALSVFSRENRIHLSVADAEEFGLALTTWAAGQRAARAAALEGGS